MFFAVGGMNRKLLQHGLFCILILLVGSRAYASDPQLSCTGVSENWFLSIDPLLEAFEYNINTELQKYVSIADFNVGDDDFGASGTGDLGHITIPKFNNKTPKQYLKSAVQDMGISPSYAVNAKILGGTFEVVKVLATAGQGCNAKNDQNACANGTPTAGQSDKDRLTIDVKVVGISVLSDENESAEVEVPSLTELAGSIQNYSSSLPTRDKKGAGGELMNIRRGFNGDQPIARIPIYGIFFITIDAGYTLHLGLAFTYGVKADGIFSIGGSTNYSFNSSATYATNLGSYAPKFKPPGGISNPALDPENYQSCSFGSSNCSSVASTPGWTKSKKFWSSMGTIQNASNAYMDLASALRDTHIREAFKDAKMTKILFKEKLDKLKNGNLSTEEKIQLMQEMDIGPLKKDLQSVGHLIDSINYSYNTITSIYSMIETAMQSISQGEFPLVTASAGVMFEGTARVWVNANVEVNLYSLVQAWVGIEGELTLVDAIMGIGASVSSQSQYLDITGKLDYEVLDGKIKLRWGYSVLGGIIPGTSNHGDMDLINFDGKTKRNNSLIARLDFDPPQGKDMFFWCADLFDNNANLDTERCGDVNVAIRKITPMVATHDEYQLRVLDEDPVGKKYDCVIENDGKFIYSSDESASICNDYIPLPNTPLASTPSTNGSSTPHPIAKAYTNNSQLFLTYLRDDQNHPMMKMVAITPNGGKKVETYISPQAVQLQTSNNQILPQPFIPTAIGYSDASINDRLFTITSHGVVSIEATDPSAQNPTYVTKLASADIATGLSDYTNPKYLVKLDDFKNDVGGTYPAGTKIFVGHLAGLHNRTLVDMANKYRLGMCRIAGDGNTTPRRIMVGDRIYPDSGQADGDTFKNAQDSKLGCSLELLEPLSLGQVGQWEAQVEQWEACQLRSLVMQGLCYPADRVTELVQLDNLTDDEIQRNFFGPNRRITGVLGFGDSTYELNGGPLTYEVEFDQPPLGLTHPTGLGSFFATHSDPNPGSQYIGPDPNLAYSPSWGSNPSIINFQYWLQPPQTQLVWETTPSNYRSLAHQLSFCPSLRGGGDGPQLLYLSDTEIDLDPNSVDNYNNTFFPNDDPPSKPVIGGGIKYLYKIDNIPLFQEVYDAYHVMKKNSRIVSSSGFEDAHIPPSLPYRAITNTFIYPKTQDRPVESTYSYVSGSVSGEGGTYYTYSSTTATVLNDDNCVPNDHFIDDYKNGTNSAIAPIISQGATPWGSGNHHQVSVACDKGPFGVTRWRGFISSLKETKPYVLQNKYRIDGCLYPNPNNVPCYDPIVETYNELPLINSSGKVDLTMQPNICGGGPKHISQFPSGPAYGQAKLQQMISGAQPYRQKVTDTIRLCLKDGLCRYYHEAQIRNGDPQCNFEADTFSANNNQNVSVASETVDCSNTKTLNDFLGSHGDYNDALHFCTKNLQTLQSTLPTKINSNSALVKVTGTWLQAQNLDTPYSRTVYDPPSGRRTIGQCLFEKKNGVYELVGASNKENPDPATSDCRLDASSKSVTGLKVALSQTTVSNFKGDLTPQICKSKLGFFQSSQNASIDPTSGTNRTSMQQAMSTIQVASTCSALTGSQLVALIQRGILPADGIGSFDLMVTVSNPSSSNHGQSVKVGTCSYGAKDKVMDKISDQTQCKLQMTTVNGYSSPAIEIYMPPAQSGVSRIQQCADQIYRFTSSYGQPAICSDEIRKRSEYATLIGTTASDVSIFMSLGGTPVGDNITCSGPALHEDQGIPLSEYNEDCQVSLRGYQAPNPEKNIYLSPIEKMYAVDPNKAFSVDHGLTTALTMCSNYWNNHVNRYKADGSLGNSAYCHSIREAVKTALPDLNPSISSPDTTDISVEAIQGSVAWSTDPTPQNIGVGPVVSVDVSPKVYSLTDCSFCNPQNNYRTPASGGGSKLDNAIPMESKESSATQRDSSLDILDQGLNLGLGNVGSDGTDPLNKQNTPGGGSGGGGSSVYMWHQGPVISQCNYKFKQLANGKWDLVDINWEDLGEPVSTFNPSNVRTTQCIKGMDGLCTSYAPGDLLIFAGSGNRALQQYRANQVPSPLDQNLVNQFCDANYDKLVALSDTIEPNPEKRFPVWLRFVNPDGSVDLPTASTTTAYYCKPKVCEMWIEFGSEYLAPTESPWKDNLSAMPTSASACNTYYQGQVSSYCSKLLLLSQMPDNLDVTLRAKFGEQDTIVGVCPATSQRRVCNIGQRKPQTWMSWLTGNNFSTVESVENFNRALVIPSKATKKDLIIPNFFPNTLAECVKTAQELNANNQLCTRNASGINHNDLYEIAVQFGEFTQTVSSCSLKDVSEEIPSVAEKKLNASIHPKGACDYQIHVEDYVPNATLQIASCAHRNCEPNELFVNYATQPNGQREQADLNFKDILEATWNKSGRGLGSIYINQADALGHLGKWVQIDADAYAKLGSELTQKCGVAIQDIQAKIVGTVCESTYLEIEGYEQGSIIEVGVCPNPENKCTSKDFNTIYKQENLQKNQMEFLPVIEAVWPVVGDQGTVGVRQRRRDGTVGTWAILNHDLFLQSATSAINECGVRP